MTQEFFNSVREQFGALKQSQVDGFNVILSATEGMNERHRAYILATAWHETAATMQPIAEYGKGKGKAYGKADITGRAPYGRGYVQLTWRENYVKADRKLGLNGTLAANYDLAMEPDIAAKIITQGMADGWFTGKRLSDFATYKEMRKIVNGTDKAALIADYAIKFEVALKKAADAPKPAPQPAPVNPAPAPVQTQYRGLLKAILDLLLAIFSPRKG